MNTDMSMVINMMKIASMERNAPMIILMNTAMIMDILTSMEKIVPIADPKL